MTERLKSTYRQISLDRWPTGLDEVAFTTPLDIHAVAARLGADPACDHDNLDEFDAILMEFTVEDREAIEPVAFRSYRHAPIRQVEVLARAASVELLRAIITELDIGPSHITWVSESAAGAIERARQTSAA